MGMLLLIAAAFLVIRTGPLAADAARISYPNAHYFEYPVKMGSPVGSWFGWITIRPENSSSSISWHLDAACSEKFELRLGPFSTPTFVVLVPRKKVPQFPEEKYFYCNLYVYESGRVTVAPFTVITVLQNYTCSFEESAPAGSVCPTFLHNTSQMRCVRPGIVPPHLGALFEVSGVPCRIRTRTTFDRERTNQTSFRMTVGSSFSNPSSVFTTFIVNIFIGDVNDNSPSCAPRGSILTWPEDVLVSGFQVSEFNCTDADKGKSGEMVCATESSGFHANMTDRTCSITLTTPLHPEKSRQRTLTVIVKDQAYFVLTRRTVTYTFTVVAVSERWIFGLPSYAVALLAIAGFLCVASIIALLRLHPLTSRPIRIAAVTQPPACKQRPSTDSWPALRPPVTDMENKSQTIVVSPSEWKSKSENEFGLQKMELEFDASNLDHHNSQNNSEKALAPRIIK